MKFEELKKNLKQKIDQNYLLMGTDTFLLDRSIKIIKEGINLQFEDLNYYKFNDVADFKLIVNALNTMPIMSDKKLVYVDISSKHTQILNINCLYDYLYNPNKSSVLLVKIGENNSAITEESKSYFEIVDCFEITKVLAKKFIDAYLLEHNKKIDNSAFDLLYSYCLGDMGKIVCETEKLIYFVSENNNIDDYAVKENVQKNIEYKIYELTDALGNKNSEKAFEILSDLKTKKDGIKGVLVLIYNHFKRLLSISLNKNEISKISKLLGIKEYAIKMNLKQCCMFSPKKLKMICDYISKLDYETKNSQTNIILSGDMIVLYVLNI